MIGNRARHRSSKQASSAGMKLYYKGHARGSPGKRRGLRPRPLPVPPRPEGSPSCACSPAASAIPIWNCSAATTASRARPATSSSPKWWRRIRRLWSAGAWPARSTWPARNCEWCRRGLGRHCPNRTVLGIVNQPGAFQEFFTLPERNLHVVPDDVPTERAVFLEPLAAACEILDQVSIPRGETVAVLGDGKLGLLIAMVLERPRATGCISSGVTRRSCALSPGPEVSTDAAPRRPRTIGWWMRPAVAEGCGPRSP